MINSLLGMKVTRMAVIILSFSLLMSTVSVSVSYADIIPPRFQAKIGIPNDDIVCDSGLFKVVQVSTDSVACVQPSSVSKLINRGWAQSVNEESLNNAINRKNVQLGKINILETIPIPTNLGRQASNAPTAGYSLIFEVCAISPIYSPDVLISSDSESKHYELVEQIEADSCVLSATTIRAANPESINITIQNKGDISEKIVTLQQELDELKQELQITRQSLKLFDQPEAQSAGQKVQELRKQINEKREELYRIMFAVHAPQASKEKIERMTFSGKVIEGESASILAILDTKDPGIFDAVFESCAGPSTIRLPVINVSSDKEAIAVKLGAKISANTCQMSSTKIIADDKDSISATPAGNADSSNKASDLELRIVSLQNELTQEKQKLRTLIQSPSKPDNFNEQIDNHVLKIGELRGLVTDLKAEFSKILYRTYN